MFSPPVFPTPPSRRRRRRFSRSAAILALLAVLLAMAATRLWAASSTYHRSGDPLEGELRIVGSRDAAIPVARWSAILRREHPQVRVLAMLYGTGTGAGAIADGAADLAPLDRVLRARERSLIAAAGVSPRSVAVGPWTAGARPLLLYRGGGGDRRSDAIAEEFVRVALSREGRAALADIDRAR